MAGEGGRDGRQGDLGVYPASTGHCAPRGRLTSWEPEFPSPANLPRSLIECLLHARGYTGCWGTRIDPTYSLKEVLTSEETLTKAGVWGDRSPALCRQHQNLPPPIQTLEKPLPEIRVNTVAPAGAQGAVDLEGALRS